MALNAEGPLVGKKRGVLPEDVLTDRMAIEAAPAMESILEQIEIMMGAATSLPELRQMLLVAFPDVDASILAQVLALGLVAADAGGRVAVLEGPAE